MEAGQRWRIPKLLLLALNCRLGILFKMSAGWKQVVGFKSAVTFISMISEAFLCRNGDKLKEFQQVLLRLNVASSLNFVFPKNELKN